MTSVLGIGERPRGTPNTDGPTDDAAGIEDGCEPVTMPPPSAASPGLGRRPQRRTLSEAAKLRILEETNLAADTAWIAAITCCEGLYCRSDIKRRAALAAEA